MKTLLTISILVFTVMFSSTSFAQWTKVGNNSRGDTFYIDFERIFPVSLTDITFAADVGDIDFITAQVVFKFFKYTIRDKNFKPI